MVMELRDMSSDKITYFKIVSSSIILSNMNANAIMPLKNSNAQDINVIWRLTWRVRPRLTLDSSDRAMATLSSDLLKFIS